MPIRFSIAGIRAVKKPKPKPVAENDQENQNQKPQPVNGATNSDNGGSASNATASAASNHLPLVAPKPPSQDLVNVASTSNAGESSNVSNATTSSQSNHPALAPKPSQPVSPKRPSQYRRPGKLTIVKKGKNGCKSIIQRLPVYNEDYDSSDDEGNAAAREPIYVPPRLLLQTDEEILLEQLDADITRQEETELLDRLSDEILEQEEADLMRRLAINIEQAEYMEQCAAKPSVIIIAEDPNEPRETTSLLSVQVPRNEVSPPKLVFQPAIGEAPKAPEGVEIVGDMDFCMARIKLPRYLDQEHRILAFTKAEFYTGVIQPFEEDMLGITEKSLYGCGASLVVSSEDPFSYVMEARGPREALNELKRQTECWIQDRIRMVNSRLLLRDGASVVITYGVNPRLTDEEITSERANYHERVVAYTEKQFGWIDKSSPSNSSFLEGWKIKEQFKGDPDKCVITAKGKIEVLKRLEELSKNWVETESLHAHSFEVEPLQTSTKDVNIKVLKMTFRMARYVPLGFVARSAKLSKTQLTTHYSNNGVWLSGIKEGTRLAFMMGSSEVFEKGCSLLSIAGKECNSPEDVQRIYLEARDNVKNIVVMTLCLSRYTDFLSIPDFAELRTARIDGKPFELSDYDNPESIVTTTWQQEEQEWEERQRQAEKERAIHAEQHNAEKQPEDDVSIEQPDFATADDEDVQPQEQPNDTDPFNDSDSDESIPVKEKKAKRIPKKKKDSARKVTEPSTAGMPAKHATESVVPAGAQVSKKANKPGKRATEPVAADEAQKARKSGNRVTESVVAPEAQVPKKTGKSGKRSAEQVAAADAQIPKKPRAGQAKKTTRGASTSSSLAPSTNPSKTTTSSEIRPATRLEKENAQKTKTTSRVGGVRESSSHGAPSNPLAELHSLKPPAKQKRIPATRPVGEPTGKKQKGNPTEGKIDTAMSALQSAIPRRKSNEQIGSTLFQEYEIEFPYNEPIGAFFKTDGSKCKVFSVFKKGNAMKDKKIMPGTVAVAISISRERQDISTRAELREHYFRAKRQLKKIRIFFVDSDVMSHTLDLHSDLDWTENGIWTGRHEGGWAGGAKTMNSVAHTSKKLAGGEASSELAREGRKVKFSDSESVKFFVAGSATDQWYDPEPKSPTDRLKDAVMNHHFSKLIEVLETGLTSDPGIIDFLRTFYDEYIRGAAKKDDKDMQAKKKIIGIYLDICLHVEQAMELKHTSTFKLQIHSIELQKKSNSRTVGRTEILGGRVSVKRVKGVDELGSLHKTQTKASITYDESERKVFLPSGNSQLKLDRCDLFIDFREGAGEDAVPAAKIGSVKIPLAEIDLKCPVDKPYITRRDLKPGPILSKGTVKLEFNRCKKDRNYIEKQRRNLTKYLKDQISFIQRFNEEYGGRLTANIQGVGNASPLHAAINLHEEGMVKELLDLGADPTAESSCYGSPTNLATELKDRLHKKLLDLINKGSPSSATEPVQKLYDMYSRILRLFLKAKQGPKGAESNDDQSYSDWASGASEDEQKKRLFETMHEIFSTAPESTGGLKDGLEASKNFVLGNLRFFYSGLCPDVASVKEFVKDAIRLKVVVSISPTKFMLAEVPGGSEDQGNASKKKEAPLPETQFGWVHQGKSRCTYYLKGCCKFGSNCRDAHIYRVPQDEDSRLVLESKELLRKEDAVKLESDYTKILARDGWFTARYWNPKKSKSLYFHAEGGRGKQNRFGIHWYPTLHEAKDALRRVLTFQKLKKRRWKDILFHEKSNTGTNSSSKPTDQNKPLPALKDKDWMVKHVEFPRLPSGKDPKDVQDGDYWTVEDRFGDTIGHQLKIFLDPDDVYIVERNGYYTSAFADRARKKIIYVEGGNSKESDQKVHWYLSETEARNALEPVVAASRKRSADK